VIPCAKTSGKAAPWPRSGGFKEREQEWGWPDSGSIKNPF
jgi:hypothetical protein